MKGRVLRSTGSWYNVQLEDGRLIECRIKGKFRLEENKVTNPIAVGDWVTISQEEGLETAVISAIDKRQNYIVRKSPKNQYKRHIIAANIDQAVLIVTFSKPRTSLGFIDRFLVITEMYHIPAVIVFNKQDVYKKKDHEKFAEAVAIYEPLGYPCLQVSAITGHNMEAFQEMMLGKTSLVSGHSGVGKSTLLNTMRPDLQLATGKISAKFNKGRHTTTFAEMHELTKDTYIIDTPGIKEFGIMDLELPEVGHYFSEFRAMLNDCQFNNCLHKDEPDCAIKYAFVEDQIAESRYMSYLSVLEEIQAKNYWERKV